MLRKQKDKNWFARNIASGSFSGAVAYFTKAYAIPVGMPIMTVFLGWLSNFPWFYIWLGFLASLALVFHWLLKMDEWLLRRRVENKIVFSSIRFGKDIHDDGGVKDGDKSESIVVGFEIANLADFPIDFKVSELKVKLGDKVPEKDYEVKQAITIPIKGMGWNNSNIIIINDPPKPGTVEGYIDFTLDYGRSNLEYSLSMKKYIIVKFNNEGFLEGGVWNDAV